MDSAGSVDDRAADGQDGAMAIRRRDAVDGPGAADGADGQDAVDGRNGAMAAHRRDVVDDRGGAEDPRALGDRGDAEAAGGRDGAETASAADGANGAGGAGAAGKSDASGGPGGAGGAPGQDGADRAVVMEGLTRFHYLRWDELPENPVFLDELVAIVNGMHASVPYGIKKKKCFTTSMASNYVKQKLTPPPLGKRYAREHISKILFAATLKIVFNAEDVAALTELEYAGRDCAEVHDRIAEAFNTGMGRMMERHVHYAARQTDVPRGTSRGTFPAPTSEPASHEARSADASQDTDAGASPGASPGTRQRPFPNEDAEGRIDALLADAFSSKVLALALVISR